MKSRSGNGFGVRLGYQGGSLKEWLDQPRPLLAASPAALRGVQGYKLDAKYDYFHADVLWDLTNLIYPRHYNRIWSLIPYYHTGFYNVNTTQGKLFRDGFAAGFGLINTLRMSAELGAFIDLRATVLNANLLGLNQGFGYKGTVLAGLTYNIGGVGNWTTASQYRHVYNLRRQIPIRPYHQQIRYQTFVGHLQQNKIFGPMPIYNLFVASYLNVLTLINRYPTLKHVHLGTKLQNKIL